MSDGYRTIGQYVLFKEILRDELGTLYRAGEVDRNGWRRTVWLRVLEGPGISVEALEEQAELVTRLGQEMKAANVVARQELRVVDGVPILAWDHVPAHTMSQLFAKTREEGFPVPVDNALLIIEKLALALAAGLSFEVGGMSLVHGFLHPGLIMVSNEGEAQVAGFGVAEQLLGVLDDPEARERCASYLAPEVLEARSTTKRSDVYSLGAILFELLTGNPLPADPAARAAALDGATLALEDEPVPEDIAALLKRSLAHSPAERFSSAADFKKELDKLLYGGNYSPTTFNLALFIDRLFRSDIEQEERERLAEAELDPGPFLTPEPAEEEDEAVVAAKARSRAGMWIALAAALVLAAVALVVLGPRLQQPKIPPTPTPEEIAAKKAEEQKRFEALVQEELQRMLAEQQAKAQQELEQRQKEIEALKRKLNQMEGGGSRSMSAAQRRQAEALKQQLAKAEEEKKAREARLEEERRKALEEAKKKAEQRASQATPTAEPEPSPEPTATPAPQPTPASPEPTPTARITEGMYVPLEEVDTPPVVLRREFPRWTRMAQNSRRKGVVIVSARVNAQGRVESVKVLRADDKGFGIPRSAMDAVRGYLFKPATKNGVKVATDATVAVPYSFRGR